MLKLNPSINYYWQAHRRHYANGRLAWYAETADESFWHDYWETRLTPDYFRAAASKELSEDEMGRVLLREMGQDGRHLEAGCGAGYWVAALQSAGYQIEGVEYSRDLVNLVNHANTHLPVRCEDALAMDCADNTYDSYVSFGVVEHRQTGPDPFLSEAYRIVKPGGKIIISVPFLGAVRRMKGQTRQFEKLRPDVPFFQYAFSRAEFVEYVRAAGFDILSSHPLYAHRMLLEESGLYRWLTQQRGGRFVKAAARSLLKNRDGHMLLVIGQKPI